MVIPTEAREQLNRILASETFARSKRLSDFLRFVVEETMEGRGTNLKEQVLAAELYGRGSDFDTSLDSVVRVDARRLRDKLREYYAESGDDPVIIMLPKGAYVPVFEVRARPSARVEAPRWRVLVPAALLALAILAAGVAWFTRGSVRHISSASIAVLPLESLSADPGQEYLADGMTDALITDLAKVHALRVISRTSVLQFKKTRQPIGKIAATLGVDYVVEGTMLPAGDRIRVTVQLIAVRDEHHVWADIYERNSRDLLTLESEVAATIASRIPVPLTPQDHTRLVARKPTGAPQAVDAYLKGRYQWNKRTPEGLNKSLEYFRQAVAIDPHYALGWAGLADAYSILANYVLLPPKEAFPLSYAAAQRALQLDNTLAEAHAALANSATDPPAAEPEFLRALELSPNCVWARQWHAENLMFLGRNDEALWEINKAIDLDPLSPLLRAVRAKISYYGGRYEDTIRDDRHAIEMDPALGAPGAKVMLSLAYAHLGRWSEAISELKSEGAWDGSTADIKSPVFTAILGYVYAKSGNRDQASTILHRLRAVSHVEPYAMTGLTTALGRTDEAFAWLNQAYNERDNLIYMLKVDSDLAPLRSDPRFADLLGKLHMI